MIVGVTREVLGGGQGGDDLVGVHIGRGTRAGLEDVDGEMLVAFACDDAVSGGDDSLRLLFCDDTEFLVGQGCCALDVAKGGDVVTVESFS